MLRDLLRAVYKMLLVVGAASVLGFSASKIVWQERVEFLLRRQIYAEVRERKQLLDAMVPVQSKLAELAAFTRIRLLAKEFYGMHEARPSEVIRVKPLEARR